MKRKNAAKEKPVACTSCRRADAVVRLEYSGLDLCARCFCKLFERRVAKANRDFSMLRRGDRIAVAISGGKDSAAMLHALDKMARRFGEITLVPILVDEGIRGYRDEAKKKAKELCRMHGYKLTEVSFAGLSKNTLDEIIKKRDKSTDAQFRSQRACTICGVLRRHLINKAAKKAGANKVAIGHNADDTGQTFLMNFLRADADGATRFSPVSDFDAEGGVVPRIKPLIYLPERECAYYCELKGLPYYLGGCPYSKEAFRGIVKDFLNDAEGKYPGVKFNVLKSYFRLNRELAGRYKQQAGICKKCGTRSSGQVCRACSLLEKISRTR